MKSHNDCLFNLQSQLLIKFYAILEGTGDISQLTKEFLDIYEAIEPLHIDAPLFAQFTKFPTQTNGQTNEQNKKGNIYDDQFYFGPYSDELDGKSCVYFGQYGQGLKQGVGRATL